MTAKSNIGQTYLYKKLKKQHQASEIKSNIEEAPEITCEREGPMDFLVSPSLFVAPASLSPFNTLKPHL